VLAPQGVAVRLQSREEERAAGRRPETRQPLAHALERRGWLDLRQERLRKSDHLNPLADIPDLERTAGAAGFRVDRIGYYTPVVGRFRGEHPRTAWSSQGLGRRAAPPRGTRRTAVPRWPFTIGRRRRRCRARCGGRRRSGRGGPAGSRRGKGGASRAAVRPNRALLALHLAHEVRCMALRPRPVGAVLRTPREELAPPWRPWGRGAARPCRA